MSPQGIFGEGIVTVDTWLYVPAKTIEVYGTKTEPYCM